jgi:DNA polymerase (family 10)
LLHASGRCKFEREIFGSKEIESEKTWVKACLELIRLAWRRDFSSASFLFGMSTLHVNIELAQLFRQMSNAYRFLGKEQRFRSLAYDRAATELTNMKESVERFRFERKALIDMKNIGESIADKIIEYLNSGKIDVWEKLKKQVPVDLLTLLQAEGIGPSTIRLLHDHWKVQSKNALLEKMHAGKPESIPGIGPHKWNLIRQALQTESLTSKRFPLDVVEPLAQEIAAEIQALLGVETCIIAGSLRRKKTNIGDIDLIVMVDLAQIKSIYQKLSALSAILKVLQKGSRKMQIQLKKIPIRVDIRFIEKSAYGSALLYFTGPKEHNLAMRKLAITKGFKLNEYGLYERLSMKRLAGQTEKSVYQMLGLPFINPENRTGTLPIKAKSLIEPTKVMVEV